MLTRQRPHELPRPRPRPPHALASLRTLHAPPFLILPCLLACHTPPIENSFDSPDPAAQLPAILQSAKAPDPSDIPQLVRLLQSEDPAVRFLAIDALDTITGQTLGYRAWDTPPERAAAVERWLRVVAERGLGANSSTPAPEPDSP